MSKAQLVITAVVLEGHSKSEVARDYDVSRNWVQQLVKRYEAEGASARSNPTHADPGATRAPSTRRWKNTSCGYAKPWPEAVTTPAPNTCPATPPSPQSLQ
jgi:transposase-like protein